MQKYFIVIPFALLMNLTAVKAGQLRDSIGVENLNGKKLIVHQVVAKDTYYSLGRRYNVPPKEIMAYNENKFLSIGLIVKVPTSIPFTAATATPATKAMPLPVKGSTQPATPPEQGDTELVDHVVQRKENLMMLAERYGTTVTEIKKLNNLHSINLQIGQVLKMPVKAGTALETQENIGTKSADEPPAVQVAPAYKKQEPAKKTITEAQPAAQDELIVHTVAGNETMYSIATKYDLTLDQLKAKNNLTTNSLYVGQKLLIKGHYPVKGEHARVEAPDTDEDTDSTESVKSPSLRMAPSRYGLSQMDEKGTGMWITDQDLDPSKMLVLHRTAPIGTIMKITNPMSNRSTFAKVVGKFTENESTKDVIIVVTKAVADAVGALDKRFLCNLTYSGQANEQ